MFQIDRNTSAILTQNISLSLWTNDKQVNWDLYTFENKGQAYVNK